MAYEKQNWKCGDIVSAEKLNHMEDGIAECCSGGGDVGYECAETTIVLFNDNITTVENSGYIEGDLGVVIDADTLAVTVDGMEYSCEKNEDGSYGAAYNGISYDWSVYPFYIFDNHFFGTETAGTYSVKIEAIETSVTTTPCFRKAVGSVVSNKTALFVTGNYFSGVYDKFSHSVQDIFDVIANHGIVMVSITNSAYSNSHSVYTPYLVETVNGDATAGVFGDITKIYFVNMNDNSVKVSATITNGEDVWATVNE